MTIDELCRLLRQLRDEPEPDPMKERLLEMYQEWWDKQTGISKTPVSLPERTPKP